MMFFEMICDEMRGNIHLARITFNPFHKVSADYLAFGSSKTRTRQDKCIIEGVRDKKNGGGAHERRCTLVLATRPPAFCISSILGVFAFASAEHAPRVFCICISCIFVFGGRPAQTGPSMTPPAQMIPSPLRSAVP